MKRCGLSLNGEGEWKEEHLSKELQAIISRENFDGIPVRTEHDLDGEATDTDDEMVS